MASRLSDDLDALLAMHAEDVATDKIARLLQRPIAWCERQLALDAERREKMARAKAVEAERDASRMSSMRDMAAKGRETLAAKRADKAETSSCSTDAGVYVAGRVTRAFAVWPRGYGAQVAHAHAASGLIFVETGPRKAEAGDVLAPVFGAGVWTAEAPERKAK
jgi:hypothetical protein